MSTVGHGLLGFVSLLLFVQAAWSRGTSCAGYLESIVVPVNGSTVNSKTILAQNETYSLRANGLFFIGGPGLGDAGYAFNCNSTYVQSHCGNDPSAQAIGMEVADGHPNHELIAATADWGPFSKEQHTYIKKWTGKGQPLALRYLDCYYNDNVGQLTVHLFRNATSAAGCASHDSPQAGFDQAALAHACKPSAPKSVRGQSQAPQLQPQSQPQPEDSAKPFLFRQTRDFPGGPGSDGVKN